MFHTGQQSCDQTFRQRVVGVFAECGETGDQGIGDGRIVTSGDTQILRQDITPAGDNVIWFERYSNNVGETKAYSLAEYAGKELYIGFRHYKQTDGNALCLDNVKLVTDSELTPEEPVDFTAPARQ